MNNKQGTEKEHIVEGVVSTQEKGGGARLERQKG
jgi:hypothetical protein